MWVDESCESKLAYVVEYMSQVVWIKSDDKWIIWVDESCESKLAYVVEYMSQVVWIKITSMIYLGNNMIHRYEI